MKNIVLIILLMLNNLQASKVDKFVESAMASTQMAIEYDPGYFKIKYPLGDVPKNKGVCTDVVIRSYRAIGIDLQELVHKDMQANFHLYPKIWGLKSTDTNIDHRRVPNLQVFFKRFGTSLPITCNPKNFQPGDIVAWDIGDNRFISHIGIVVNTYAPNSKIPMVVHNIGAGPQCENVLFGYKIIGHYRYGLKG
ncbi:MAG: DUF1287 domain-containing protein [Alphaproteobacteria bacterium CG_4_10_14_0_8_um_filter_37_21]|nr:MAG: DUF1287 domain-containing protein [Alphaproteobacteria bacterium CG_4_10_14_0_8_um_filter_37_21]